MFVIVLYTLTIFLSAMLLFVVQPMFTRFVLPLLGGSPAVWNTAQVFFQAALLAGYGYAYGLSRWLKPRWQAWVHLVVLGLGLLVLPLRLPPGEPPTTGTPVWWLLGVLAVAVGLPFFAVAASSPLFQRWFADSDHPRASDPYFLYAASNLGSLLALLAYPALVEPTLRLAQQSWVWAIGYGLLILLVAGCGLTLWARSGGRKVETATTPPSTSTSGSAPTERLTAQRRLRWVLLAFAPSSLMLSVTSYISTDIAAIPLLWIVPLSLYLLTFILAFARKSLLPQRWINLALPFLMLALVFFLVAQFNDLSLPLIAFHLLTFFGVALACHSELARSRPDPAHLTEFYLWLSVGGVLGGSFNALLSPLLFKDIVEYPLTLMLAALVLPGVAAIAPTLRQRRREREQQELSETRRRWLDAGLPVGLLLLTAGLVTLLQSGPTVPGQAEASLMFGVPALLCLAFMRRPIRFGLGIGAILLASTLYAGADGRPLYTQRSFFGVNRVTTDYSGLYHILYHGTTIHGLQNMDPAQRREPLSYFHRGGPLAQVFAAFNAVGPEREVAIVGLGVGSMACYRQPPQRWTFYEIDPVVEQIARDPDYFTFLQDCTPESEVILGDARLSLVAARPGQYGLIILDAYSSDAVPIHLTTREAVRLYLDKLAPEGLLVFNITNKRIQLEPVLARLAQDAGLISQIQIQIEISQEDLNRGKVGSSWFVMARTPEALGNLTEDTRWRFPQTRPNVPVWTDDFNSLLSVIQWR